MTPPAKITGPVGHTHSVVRIGERRSAKNAIAAFWAPQGKVLTVVRFSYMAAERPTMRDTSTKH